MVDKFVSATNISAASFDVACLGELVIDMAPAIEPDGRVTYEPKAGGAPGNVAVGLARLGRRAAMISKVGDESFGRLLTGTLEHNGVDTRGVVRSAEQQTSLAFVTLGSGGEREFLFYRNNAPDLSLSPEELSIPVVTSSSVLHVNTVMLLGRLSAGTQLTAIALAREAGLLISVDINFRRALWSDHQRMIAFGGRMVGEATILKVTEEELCELAAGASIPERVRSLWHPSLRICAVTKGAAGAELFTAEHHFECPAFTVDAVDTTGAGDAFAACLLSELIGMDFDLSSEEGLATALRRACAAGALSTTRKGAMESMPDTQQVDALCSARYRATE